MIIDINFLKNEKGILSAWKIKKHADKIFHILQKYEWLGDVSPQEKIYCYVNNIENKVLCKTCKKNTTKFKTFESGYQLYCSLSCSNSDDDKKENTRKSNLEKYGVDNPSKLESTKDKVKKSNLEKYGVDCTLQLDSVKDKSKETMIDKYGVDNPSKSEHIKEKRYNTMIERYGVRHALQNDCIKNKIVTSHLRTQEIKDKIKLIKFDGNKNAIDKLNDVEWLKEQYKSKSVTDIAKELNITVVCLYNYIKKYNIEIKPHHTIIENIDNFNKLNDVEWLKEQYKSKSIKTISKELDIGFSCVNNKLNIYNIKTNDGCTSSIETEIISFIKSIYSNEVITNTRKVIPPLELDIYIPEKKLAIELNGVYWHSTKYKDKNYHLAKTLKCENRGIQLLHIFDFEWEQKQEIWKSVIANKLGVTSNRIYARKCIIKEVSSMNGKIFFDDNHLQGGLSRGKHIGLYVDHELVSCLSYGASRFKKDEIEIYRFANKLNTNVVGGFSRLLKQIEYKEIISYANRRWSTGNVYSKNGFELVDETPPNYFYYKNGETYSRQKFQKHKLKEMKSYSDEKTEEQIMDEEGYLRIYDCGNLKYKYYYNKRE